MSLSTKYLGLDLKSPLIASSSPQNSKISYLRQLEDAGAAAVVLPSLFQEQIESRDEELSSASTKESDNNTATSNYFPASEIAPYGLGPDEYLNLIRLAKENLSIPVIASLNGATESDWVNYARLFQEAGASAIELNNYYVPYDFSMSGRDIEQHFISILSIVRQAVTIPVSVKLLPFMSSLGHYVNELKCKGADGFVLFNRVLQPDIDLLTLRLNNRLLLSSKQEMSLSMLWISLLAQNQKRQFSLAASTGVREVDDIIKYLLVGADVVMMTSVLLRHGPEYLKVLHDGLEKWVSSRGYSNLSELRGLMSKIWMAQEQGGGRKSYIKMLNAFQNAAV